MLAWSDVNLYRFPDGVHLWGCEFELLPTGSMFAAKSILHGIVGVAAEMLDESRCQVCADSGIEVYAMGETTDGELEGYRQDLEEWFKVKTSCDA